MKTIVTDKAIRRVIHPEVRVLDVKKGICEYVASDETLDSYNEIVLASGWQFDQFKKNAPFVDSHDYSSVEKSLGKVIDFKIENRQLIETVQWAIDVPENYLAQLGWKMTAAGYLKAVSVGFFPVEGVTCWDADPNPFNSLCLQLNADPKVVQVIYTKQQQIELSACIIGANQNALARALTEGAITQDDVQKTFQSRTVKNDSPAKAPGRADESTSRRARSWFLEKLKRVNRA